ncbi:zinc transporter [Qipengyuania sp. 6B39]|uniref:ZIP family metal transporter n=1 Tax=Qipengyuania proteolytica TaxID=2867239 RepID=UPI001C89B006|nr:zinc transporter [Qipengyuania proteolytica]MBX7494880.1 zinc transporter [Qipengyuania proteolytica]
MLMLFTVVLVVSGALVLGAIWGIYGKLPKGVEGFLVALAGGALLLSVTSELIQPSIDRTSIFHAMLGVGAGAAVFALCDYLIDEKWGSDSGGGLLAAITLDGIPENLALGVALIGAGGLEVAALAGSILLSNLPEAAGGARAMAEGGRSKAKVLWLWVWTAAILSAAAIIGNLALEGVGEGPLAIIRCFAAGAVIASLATEVFPQAYREDRHWAGVATALGAILAFSLGSLAGG